jgi:predicted benzoate:H+ symporter BenE
MASLRSVKSLLGRVQPTAWIALVAGLALIIELNHTLTQVYTNLELQWQLVAILVTVFIVSITGYKTFSIDGILKPKKRRK